MKIFLSFLQSKIQHPIAAYSFWQYYIKNGIEEAGHTWDECAEVDWAYGLVPQSAESLKNWKNDAWSKTIAYLKKNKPALFLSYLYPVQVDEEAILEIRKMGIFCVNFFCDNVRNFTTIPSAFGVFDLNWVPEYQAGAMYEKAKFPYINLPMPMWVEPKYRKPSSIENGRVSFIGSKDIQRQLFFGQFFNAYPNTTIDIYGAGWLDDAQPASSTPIPLFKKIENQLTFIKEFGSTAFINKLKDRNIKPVMTAQLQAILKHKPDFETYIKLTRESLVTIGINRYPGYQFPVAQPNSYSRLRDIEAPMLGACYLTEWTAGLDQLYDIGEEIEVFKDPDELNDKITTLLSDDQKRLKLRLKGQKAALNKHSVVQSLEKIITKIT